MAEPSTVARLSPDRGPRYNLTYHPDPEKTYDRLAKIGEFFLEKGPPEPWRMWKECIHVHDRTDMKLHENICESCTAASLYSRVQNSVKGGC